MVHHTSRAALLLGAVLLFQAAGFAVSPVGSAAVIAAGDSAFSAMKYGQALDMYQAGLARTPADAELLWRMARLEVCRGDLATGEEREEHYRRGEEFARMCIEADSNLSTGHTWRAAALGSMAMSGSARRKVELAREIKKELDIAIALNPRDDGARSILGSFYRALGNVSWIERQLASVFLGGVPSGGFEEAEKELQTAIGLRPGVFRHHYELALLYIDWDRPEDAARALQQAIQVGPTMAADVRRLEQASAQLAELR
jgi:tetratricopeptide (TPR) repeat protein